MNPTHHPTDQHEPAVSEMNRAAGTDPLNFLRARGYIQDVSDPDRLAAAFEAGTLTFYTGFDPTASSLHVGHLLPIQAMAVLQRFGHRPIALAGGGTALIGDPSGKRDARTLLSERSIAENLDGLLPQFSRYLDFAGGRFGDNSGALLVNNADWLLRLGHLEFLRDIGRYFSVGEMLASETYRTRLATTGLSFVEFGYRPLQAYDFLHLYRTEGCILQLGGSDQWGNILAGRDLIRKADGGEAFGLVLPLVTTAAGEKMGKTAAGAVWLDAARTSPFDFYQYWMGVDDADVARFLRLYTALPEERIADLTRVAGAALREAKSILAWEVTAATHGAPAAEAARESATALFDGGLGAATTAAAVPAVEIPSGDLSDLTVADLFVRAGLCRSRNEARRLAAQSGLALDGQPVTDADRPAPGGREALLLRAGKKRFRRVHIL